MLCIVRLADWKERGIELERIEMRRVVSFSGGKDSTAMLLRMLELEMPIDEIIFCDTLMEFPELHEYIGKIERHIGREITFLQGKTTWDAWFYGQVTRGKAKGRVRGFPYVIQRCWAQRELKGKPLKEFKEEGDINYVGLAKGEEKRTQRQLYSKGDYRFPLIEWGWTEQDCINYLKEKDLLNPLYSKFKRLGCWCCPKQSLSSLKSLYETYPLYWTKLKKYEADSPHGFKPNITLKELEEGYEHQKRVG